MGALTSREPPDRDNIDLAALSIYKFPPKIGPYFGSHFLMGGERFESSPPEAFLFGDNSDLSFLGSKPVQFPYPQSQGTEPTRSLQCLVNIRRDSLKFVKVKTEPELENCQNNTGPAPSINCPYNIEFTFDCDVPCTISIHYFATQVNDSTSLRFVSKKPDLSSEIYHFDVGAGQTFSSPGHIFDPALYATDTLLYAPETEMIPVVILCGTNNTDDIRGPSQTQVTYAVVDPSAEGRGFVLKPLKQKLMVNGVCLLLQEMYGIENKNAAPGEPKGADWDENGADCVVCMSELRDTLIIPCRHLCLCNACAETLRYKASNCPICRSPFRALLQMKTMRKLRNSSSTPNLTCNEDQSQDPVVTLNIRQPITNRYEPIPLVEALNGPVDHTHTCVTMPNSHMPTCSSAPIIAGGMCGPRPPPRGRLKKKAPRPVTSIQQVLTPQSIPTSAGPKVKYHMATSKSQQFTSKSKSAKKIGAIDEDNNEDDATQANPNTVCRSVSLDRESLSNVDETDKSEEMSSTQMGTPTSSYSASSVSSTKPLLVSTALDNSMEQLDSSHD